MPYLRRAGRGPVMTAIRIAATTARTFTILLAGFVLGLMTIAHATPAPTGHESACRAAALRAETLVEDYADAYAARGTAHPAMSFWQYRFSRDGWWYVEARKACGN